jgi:inner membrane protein
MVVAAQFPDIDTVWSLRGPVEAFTHHRGITHTFLGLPFEAALLVAGAYGVHWWRVRRREREMQFSPLRPSAFGRDDKIKVGAFGRDDKLEVGASGRDEKADLKPLTKAPVRWGELYGFVLLALLSHLLLDFTNNYGLRPFFPFNSHWYAASIVFIFDPLIFALLAGALVLPSLFGLVSSEVGAKRQAFRGRGLAIAALLGIVAVWTFREAEHNRAVELAMAQTFAYVPESAAAVPENAAAVPENAAAVPENAAAAATVESPDAALPDVPPMNLQAQRVLASPDPLNPFHWSIATDFGPVYQLAEVDLRNGSVTPDETTYPKPTRSPAVLAAEASPLGRAYLDWSSMPIVTEGLGAAVEDAEGPLPGAARTVVFRDPRFMGGVDWLHLGGRTPLTGQVTLDARGRVLRESMDGRTER